MKILVFALTSFMMSMAPVGSHKVNYPTPDANGLLFYVQRNINGNTVVYTLNLDKNGIADTEQPISVYWIKFAEKGKIVPLTYLQRNFAYGIEASVLDKNAGSFQFHFVSYPQRKFLLMKSAKDGRYYAYTSIHSKLVKLESIFINITGGTFLLPKISRVDIKATELQQQKEVIETIVP